MGGDDGDMPCVSRVVRSDISPSSSLDVLVRVRPAVGIGRPHIVELPSVANVTSATTWNGL